MSISQKLSRYVSANDPTLNTEFYRVQGTLAGAADVAAMVSGAGICRPETFQEIYTLR